MRRVAHGGCARASFEETGGVVVLAHFRLELFHAVRQALDNLGVCLGFVGGFPRVGLQVVQFQFILVPQQFPAALTNSGQHAVADEIEERVMVIPPVQFCRPVTGVMVTQRERHQKRRASSWDPISAVISISASSILTDACGSR